MQLLLFFLYSDPDAVLKKVQKIEKLIATIEGLAKETEVGADGIVHPANNINFMQHVDISKVSAVFYLVAEFQLKECAGIIIEIAALNRVAHIHMQGHSKSISSFSSLLITKMHVGGRAPYHILEFHT